MTRPLGWGIVGCGDVVEHKSGPSIAGADRSRIVAVMRRQPDKARPFAEAHGAALCTDDAAAVIEHPDVDIVYVATPPAAHKEYVLAAARAGKTVLVEKPMGLTAAAGRAMVEACDAAGVELFVAYYRRFQPHALRMAELIDAGRLGTPVAAQIDFAIAAPPTYDWGWRIVPSVSGGGLFVDVVSHRIDLMIRLLGAPAATVGLTATFGTTGGVEDVAAATIRFAGGAVCSVQGDFASARTADRFVIAGTDGAIVADPLDGHAFTFQAGETTAAHRFDPYPAPHLGLIRHIERVLDGAEPNGASGRDGLLTDRVIDAVLGR